MYLNYLTWFMVYLAQIKKCKTSFSDFLFLKNLLKYHVKQIKPS